MNKNALQWVWGLLACMIVILGSILASPDLRHSYDIKVLTHATFLNAIAFVVGYSILKPLKSLVFWKFIVYMIVTTAVYWFIYSMRRWNWSLPLVGGQYSWFFLIVVPYGASILMNMGFLKYLFDVETKQAALMGTLIGITNANTLLVSMPISYNSSDTIMLPTN